MKDPKGRTFGTAAAFFSGQMSFLLPKPKQHSQNSDETSTEAEFKITHICKTALNIRNTLYN